MKILTTLLLFLTLIVKAQIPTITNFSPASGPVGTTVTITGTNFSTTPTNNIVYFGATRATVASATATQLTVTVPAGATYQLITVGVGDLTAPASRPFVVTFPGGGSIEDCSFTPASVIGTVPGFTRPAFADIDGDGKPDLLIPESTNNQLSIFRNVSTAGEITPGSFEPKVSFPTVNTPFSVAVGDLDGDGNRDLAVINYRDGKLSVYKNLSSPGTIALAPKVDFNIPDFAHDVSIADIDGDGKPDLTITTSLVGLTVLRNTGTSGVIDATTFAAGVTFSTGPNPGPFVLGDIDGDGKLDAAVPNDNTYTVSILRNTSTPGTISFATQVVLTTAVGSPPAGAGTVYTVLGDLDGDNKLDLITTTNTVFTASIFRNTSTPGTLSFDPKVDILFTDNFNTPAVGDLDGDGKIDLVFDHGTNNISIYKNVSSPGSISAASFSTPVDLSRTPSSAFLIGDVNGDGRNEIFTCSASIQVFQNLIGFPPPTISSFMPSSGTIGSTVTITGANFNSPFTNTVTFNGVPATITASTATSLTVTIPVGSTSGPISVTIGCNTAISAGIFCVPSTPPSNVGLIADFPFNGNANDLSGNNNNGVVNGAVLTTDRFGNANSAYLFNGTTSYISIPNSSSLESPTTALTMNAWVNLAGYSLGGGQFGPILMKSNSAANAFMYRMNVGPTWFGGGLNNWTNLSEIPFTPQLNCWQMLTVVFDGTQSYFYLNGSLITSQAFVANITPDNLPLEIGRDVPGDLEVFNGKIDDITLYSRALSACEIASLYSPAPGPSITSFTPLAGLAGDMVTITGTNFDLTPANNIVKINGTTAVVTASTATSITTTVPTGATTGTITVTIGCSTVESSTNFNICTPPSAPDVVANSRCGDGTVILGATGTTDGNYRWYTVSSGGIPLSGEVNSSFTTPVLTSTTSYYVSIDNGICESSRSEVIATINTVPGKPVITPSGSTTLCTGQSVTLTAPAGFSYLWSTGATTQQIIISLTGDYSVVTTNSSDCSSVSSDIISVSVDICNQPPAIQSTTISTYVDGVISQSLSSLFSDPDNNLDLTSLNIISQPTSGAVASIDMNQNLIIDYHGISFSGTDRITIEICDLLEACTQQEISIEVNGEVIIYNGISPNHDGLNDFFFIQYINVLEETKSNHVYIYNRWGDVIFDMVDYDNGNRVFTGLNNNGKQIPSGIYFYKITFTSGKNSLFGFLELRQ